MFAPELTYVNAAECNSYSSFIDRDMFMRLTDLAVGHMRNSTQNLLAHIIMLCLTPLMVKTASATVTEAEMKARRAETTAQIE